MQESPHGGSINSSASSSSPVRRDAASIPPQQTAPLNVPHFCANGAAPIGGHQLLMDPVTGQHYLVPSGPPQHHPNIFYQPVYYSPTPTQPIYYQSFATGAQGAYIMASPIASTHRGAVPILPPHAIAQHFAATPPSTVPGGLSGGYASSVADSEDPRSLPVDEDQRTILQRRFNLQNESHRSSDDKIQGLVISKSQSPPSSPPFAASRSAVLLQSLTSMTVHEAVATRQDGSCQTGNKISSQYAEARPEHLGVVSQRTPLFGTAPSWWGDEQKPLRDGDGENVHNDAEVNGEQPSPAGSSVRRTFKPVRMDIDLNKPFEDEEVKKKEERTKVVARVPPTAFTVSFGTAEDGKANLSLQDAARKSTTRRLLRRSAPSSAAALASMTAAGLAEGGDPKQYLLSKMLMGSGPNAAGFSGAPELLAATGQGEAKKEIDSLSEAGTYIVDEKDRQLDQMVTSQHNDSDDDSDSDSTTTRSSDRTPSPSSTADPSQISPRIAETGRFSGEGDEKNCSSLCESFHVESSRQDRRTIEEQRTVVAPSTPPLVGANIRQSMPAVAAAVQQVRGAATTTMVPRPISGVRRGTPSLVTANTRLASMAIVNSGSPLRVSTTSAPSAVRTPHSAHAHCLTPSAANSSTVGISFRRGDGGRFSMRTASSGGLSSRGHPAGRNVIRPPFRLGGSSRMSTGVGTSGGQKESAEMTAWLRRKDYNPMKAAAEARKLQQLKARTEQFTSSRSISFHQGARVEPLGGTLSGDADKQRHNRSQDDLLTEDGCGPETILASYSKGITRDLNRLKLAESSSGKSQESGLERSVQQLALKCNRSIELIRNAHQGRLSDSVENLLERAVQPASGHDASVAEQLDRLSAAFDAIQKYLEISSTPASVPSSPSAGSASPVRCQPSSNSSSPSRQHGTFRSRLVTPKRSPSNGPSTMKSESPRR
uniref:Uncharacterized protein n=1 Tax=Parascaris univalens TaxID=6257 RepID=A0A915AQP0_PARUN